MERVVLLWWWEGVMLAMRNECIRNQMMSYYE